MGEESTFVDGKNQSVARGNELTAREYQLTA